MGKLNNKGAGVTDVVGDGLSVGVAIGTAVELKKDCTCTVAFGVVETPAGSPVRSTCDGLGGCEIGTISVGIVEDAAVQPLSANNTNNSRRNLTIRSPS